MGRKDFVSFKKKSSFLGRAKKRGRQRKNVFSGVWAENGGDSKTVRAKEESTPVAENDPGEEFFGLMESIVFKDELRDYVTSIINNAEPNEYVWEDLRVPLNTVVAGGAAPTWGQFSGNLETWLFPTNSDAEVHFMVQLPHSWQEGTDIEAHVHWAPMSTDTGDVAWCLEYIWANEGATFGAAATLTPTPDAADGTALKHQYFDLGNITGTGKTISSILICRLYRDTSEDDYDTNAALLELDFHIKLDSRGSSTETAK